MKKRWMFLLIIVIAIAVALAIVFINLFTKKSTKELAEYVNDVTQSGYLDEDSDEKVTILKYLDDITNLGTLSESRDEILTYKTMYVSYEVVGDFFNREIAFATYTKAYRKNRKPVKNNFEDAQETADKFASFIKKNEEKIAGDADWLAQSWATGRKYMKDIINKSTSAFNGLGVIYSAGVESEYLNNDYTDIIFSGFKTLAKDALSTNASVENDAETLKNFIDAYFNDDETILGYVYNISLQDKVESLKKEGSKSAYYETFISGGLKN